MTGPEGLVLSAVAAIPYAVSPMDTPTTGPLWLDSGQFFAFGLIGALVVLLLAAILVSQWRR